MLLLTDLSMEYILLLLLLLLLLRLKMLLPLLLLKSYFGGGPETLRTLKARKVVAWVDLISPFIRTWIIILEIIVTTALPNSFSHRLSNPIFLGIVEEIFTAFTG